MSRKVIDQECIKCSRQKERYQECMDQWVTSPLSERNHPIQGQQKLQISKNLVFSKWDSHQKGQYNVTADIFNNDFEIARSQVPYGLFMKTEK